jgi:hypothetical protein
MMTRVFHWQGLPHRGQLGVVEVRETQFTGPTLLAGLQVASGGFSSFNLSAMRSFEEGFGL